MLASANLVIQPQIIVGKAASYDGLATGATAFDFPLAPTKRIIGGLGRIEVLALTGTPTGTLTAKIGNNVAHDNFLAAVAMLPASSPAGVAATLPWEFRIAAMESQGGVVLLDSQLFFDVTVAYGGASIVTLTTWLTLWLRDT